MAYLAGSFPTPDLRQEPSNARSINIDILSAGGAQNNQDSNRQLPNSVTQLLRTLFPGGEIHVEEASSQGTVRDSVPEQAGTSNDVVNASETEPRVSNEGIFLSNLLRQIIPAISQQAQSESDGRLMEETNASENRIPQDFPTQVSIPHQLSLAFLCLMFQQTMEFLVPLNHTALLYYDQIKLNLSWGQKYIMRS